MKSKVKKRNNLLREGFFREGVDQSMAQGCDMIVSLYRLPETPAVDGVRVRRAFVSDKTQILDFIRKHFQDGWVCEAEQALLADPPRCFIATEKDQVIGFACFDSSAKGFFGPTGVDPTCRGREIGKALLIRTLHAMREYGYAYGIIGWVSDAEPFYRKTVGAEFIKDGYPQNSVYSNKISL